MRPFVELAASALRPTKKLRLTSQMPRTHEFQMRSEFHRWIQVSDRLRWPAWHRTSQPPSGLLRANEVDPYPLTADESKMARCDTCGNDYHKAFQVTMGD